MNEIMKVIKSGLVSYIGRQANPKFTIQDIELQLNLMFPGNNFMFEAVADKIVPSNAKSAFVVALLKMPIDYVGIGALLSCIDNSRQTLVLPDVGEMSWSSTDKGKILFKPVNDAKFVDVKFVLVPEDSHDQAKD